MSEDVFSNPFRFKACAHDARLPCVETFLPPTSSQSPAKKKKARPVMVLLTRQSNPQMRKGPKTPKTPVSPVPESKSETVSNSSSSSEDVSFFSMDKEAKLTLLSLAIVDFTSYLSMSILAPFFPKTANDKGMSDTVSGFVFGVFSLVVFISSPIFGILMGKIGTRFVFLAGMFVAGSCNILFAFLEYADGGVEFTVLCFAVRSLEALGAAAYTTATYAIIIDIFPDNIGTVFGVLETFVGLGMMVGPALGGALYSIGGFKLPFLVVGGFIVLICFPINALLLPKWDEDDDKIAPPSDMLRLLRIPVIFIVVLSITVNSAVWGFLDPILEPYLRTYNLSAKHVGLLFMVISTAYALFSPVWGLVADKVENTKLLIIAGTVTMAVALLLLGPSPLFPNIGYLLWLIILSLALLGLATSLALIPTFENLLDEAEQAGFEDDLATYGLLAGLWATAYSLGEFIGPSIAGVMYDSVGFEWSTTIVAGALAFMALILSIFCLIEWKTKKRKNIEQVVRFPSETVPTETTPLLTNNLTHPRNGSVIVAQTSVSSIEDISDASIHAYSV